MIYFDASSPSAAMSVIATKFWQSSSFSGAAISFVGGRNNAKKNSIVASEFSGMAASDIGGSILLRDSNVDVSLSSFSNNFAVSGASAVESYASIVSLSGNKLNYSGAPQVSLFRATAYSDNASFFDNGGLYCPLPTCNPARLKNGQVMLSKICILLCLLHLIMFPVRPYLQYLPVPVRRRRLSLRPQHLPSKTSRKRHLRHRLCQFRLQVRFWRLL